MNQLTKVTHKVRSGSGIESELEPASKEQEAKECKLTSEDGTEASVDCGAIAANLTDVEEGDLMSKFRREMRVCRLAQSVEHQTINLAVAGLSPASGCNIFAESSSFFRQ